MLDIDVEVSSYCPRRKLIVEVQVSFCMFESESLLVERKVMDGRKEVLIVPIEAAHNVNGFCHRRFEACQ